jgi:demethylmenaquinone methyltransferase/2-methoxy-6-polyprenyl-1,4-benzoquinol methylase
MTTNPRVAFFDVEADAPWAAAPYGADHAPKLERFFARTGPLAGRTLLEPGCGTGRLTEILARAVGEHGAVHACDISPRMCAAARERLGGLPQATVSLAAMERLPLAPASMDLVVCHQVFPHYEDKAAALAFVARVLRPGGALLVMHFRDRAAINDVHRKAGTVVEQDMLPDLEAMDALLTAAGLRREYFSDDATLGYLLHAVK